MANPFVPNMPQNDPITMLRQNPQQAQQMMSQFRANPAQMLLRLGVQHPSESYYAGSDRSVSFTVWPDFAAADQPADGP